MSEYDFEIINEDFETGFPTPVLELQNKHYNIDVVYFDDYIEDKENDKLNATRLNLICKPVNKRNKTKIELGYDGQLCITANDLQYISIEKCQDAINNLEIAKNSTIALKKIIDKYFQFNQEMSDNFAKAWLDYWGL